MWYKKKSIRNETASVPEASIVNTELKILVKIPYCGGAKPTEDMLNRTKPITATFDLIDKNGHSQEVKSNAFGLIKLALPKVNIS